MYKKNWFVANCEGDLIGHDLSEEKAKELESIVFYFLFSFHFGNLIKRKIIL